MKLGQFGRGPNNPILRGLPNHGFEEQLKAELQRMQAENQELLRAAQQAFRQRSKGDESLVKVQRLRRKVQRYINQQMGG